MRLIVGGDSLIGRNNATFFTAGSLLYCATSLSPSARQIHLDLSGDPAEWQWPDGVTSAFLCAAVTSLKACAEDPAATAFINVEQTVELARRLLVEGVFVIFPSTNLVFDGSKPFSTAHDAPNPREEYGRQKARAERALLELSGNVAVVRLTKVIHPGMPLFRSWAESLRMGEIIRPFHDLYFSPIPVEFVAKALAAIADAKLGGVTQLSGDRDISYAECGVALAKALGADEKLVQPESAGAQARRFSTLDMVRAGRELEMHPPGVAKTLDALFQHFK